MKYNSKHNEISKQNKLFLFCGLVILAASLVSLSQTLLLRYNALAFEEDEKEEEKAEQQHQGSKNGYITLFTTTNNTTEVNSSVKYIETARQLLNQVSAEYKKGNFTGVEELAIHAYLGNFEYVEPDLEKHGAKDLKEQIEYMMRVELRDMIKNRISQDQLDSYISATNLKLTEAMGRIVDSSVS